MLLIASKVFAAMADPVGLSLTFFLVGAVFAFVPRRARLSAAFIICGILVLLIFSLPLTSHFLLRGLEGRYPQQADYGEASAVVLLGGFTTGKLPPRLHVETNNSANRAFHGVRVWRGSGEPKLVLTGGVVGLISDDVVPEAVSIFELLSEFFGVGRDDVLMESESRNTRENAVNTKRMMDEAGMGSDIILVTSAFHMRRSVAVFEKAGFTVTPAPTGYFTNEAISAKPLTWLPSSGALFNSGIALREYYGIVSYKILGWI